MTYNNPNVTEKSIYALAEALKVCKRAEEIGINFEVWIGVSQNVLDNLNKIVNNLPNYIKKEKGIDSAYDDN